MNAALEAELPLSAFSVVTEVGFARAKPKKKIDESDTEESNRC